MGADIGKRKSLEGGAGEAVYYIDGSAGGGSISIVFEKEFAKAWAAGLLEAAEALPDVVPSVGVELDVKLVPKNKVMLHTEGSIQ